MNGHRGRRPHDLDGAGQIYADETLVASALNRMPGSDVVLMCQMTGRSPAADSGEARLLREVLLSAIEDLISESPPRCSTRARLEFERRRQIRCKLDNGRAGAGPV
jgi:hypothetical protein